MYSFIWSITTIRDAGKSAGTQCGPMAYSAKRTRKGEVDEAMTRYRTKDGQMTGFSRTYLREWE